MLSQHSTEDDTKTKQQDGKVDDPVMTLLREIERGIIKSGAEIVGARSNINDLTIGLQNLRKNLQGNKVTGGERNVLLRKAKFWRYVSLFLFLALMSNLILMSFIVDRASI